MLVCAGKVDCVFGLAISIFRVAFLDHRFVVLVHWYYLVRISIWLLRKKKYIKTSSLLLLTRNHSSNAQTCVNVMLINVDIHIVPGLMRLVHNKVCVGGAVLILPQASAQLSETIVCQTQFNSY